jgi:flagellar hook protein FlgE
MSFQTGLSGLNASARNLDVIGHNIANANTTGMKASRTEFAEVYASSLGATGGANAGIGVQVAAVSQLFTQGNLKVTGNQLDLAVNGSGFFVVGDRTNANSDLMYTRNGEFKLDNQGFIITNNGLSLRGTPLDAAGNVAGSPGQPIQFPTTGGIPARATGTSPNLAEQGINISANLDARADVVGLFPADPANPALTPAQLENAGRTSLSVFDATGNRMALNLYFLKTGSTVVSGQTQNTWQVVGEANGQLGAMGELVFDGAGRIIPGVSAFSTFTLPATTNPSGPSAALALRINDQSFNGLNQFASSFGVFDIRQDGYADGQLTSIDIGENGTILSRYSNGVSVPSFRIDLANFRNLQGLEPTNGGFWRETVASGQPVRGAPQTGGLGLIRQSALEESNVDLTQELVNMIVAQRAYQANAQTIKTQDQIQQTLVNLR